MIVLRNEEERALWRAALLAIISRSGGPGVYGADAAVQEYRLRVAQPRVQQPATEPSPAAMREALMRALCGEVEGVDGADVCVAMGDWIRTVRGTHAERDAARECAALLFPDTAEEER